MNTTKAWREYQGNIRDLARRERLEPMNQALFHAQILSLAA